MNTDKYNQDAIRNSFRFLVDEFGYSITRNEEMSHDTRPYAFVIEYVGNDRRVYLSHDYKERSFYFTVIRGHDTPYPNDGDNKNIRSFWQLFKDFEPQLDLKTLEPDNQTCAEAASINAQLLRKYASGILRVEELI